MTKDKCGPCKMLDWMNTREGKKDCCRYFYPPVALERVECNHTQYGFGVLVEPAIIKPRKK